MLDFFITLAPRHTKECTRGAFNHRIECLAEVRNSAFAPLYELRDAEGKYFYLIILVNECSVSMICPNSSGRAYKKNTGNYIYHDNIWEPLIYNNWTAHDINGMALENVHFKRIFHYTASVQRRQRHLPIQVRNCRMALRSSTSHRSALCRRSDSASVRSLYPFFLSLIADSPTKCS